MWKSSLITACLALSLVFLAAGPVLAQESDEGFVPEDEDPHELATIETEADPITMDEELALRIIHMGLNEPRRFTGEYMDRIVCRHRALTGSRMRYLICGTNAAWLAGEPDDSDSPVRSRRGVASGEAGFSSLARMVSATRVDMDAADGFAVFGPISRSEIERSMAEIQAIEHSEAIVESMLDPRTEVPEKVRNGTIHELAEIHVLLDDIRREWIADIESADEAERDELVEEMDRDLEAVLESHGYTVEAYNEAVARIEEDEMLLGHKAAAVEQLEDER